MGFSVLTLQEVVSTKIITKIFGSAHFALLAFTDTDTLPSCNSGVTQRSVSALPRSSAWSMS